MNQDRYNRGYGNYVVASGDCIVNFFGRFLKNHNDQKVFDEHSLKNFMMNNVNRLLYSFGSGLSSKCHNVSQARIKKVSDVVNAMRACPFTDEATIFIDSGGFQACMGYIEIKDIPKYTDLYLSFINQELDTMKYIQKINNSYFLHFEYSI